jgi:hypothetical protein
MLIKIFYSFLLVLSTLFLSGCFTVPGKDRIVIINSFVNENLGCVRPLKQPINRVEYIPADQTLKAKVHYINQCMINYSWGRGWTDEQNFKN